MKFQLIIYFCLALYNAVLAKNVRIIGGVDADIRDVSYIASLRQSRVERHFCGGAIITNRHILTAAHCIDGLDKSEYRVYVGSTSSSDYSIPSYGVQDDKMHPTYLQVRDRESKARYDIAVITVYPCIPFNEFQNKINLPTRDVPYGELALISGWGWKTYPIGWISDNLQKLSMWIISNEECALKFPNLIHDQQVCVYRNREVGTCYGDSGGPLVHNSTLIGIFSLSTPCAAGDPDVYTKVYSFLDFIESVLGSNCLTSDCQCI